MQYRVSKPSATALTESSPAYCESISLHARSRLAYQSAIVHLARSEEFDLLHVRIPVDLGICFGQLLLEWPCLSVRSTWKMKLTWYFVYDQQAQYRFSCQKERDEVKEVSPVEEELLYQADQPAKGH